MEYFIDTETQSEEIEEIRQQVRDMIAKCGLSEVRYDESPVVAIENTITLHGTYELLEVVISPLLDNEELIVANNLSEELMMNCSSAVIYPLIEDKRQ